MQTQTIFRAGNSQYVVAIPKHIAKEINLKQGQRVVVEKIDEDSVIVRKDKGLKVNKAAAKKEFENWLKRFMKENAEALDELAVR